MKPVHEMSARELIDEQRTALFRALCRRERLPAPTTEYEFHHERKWRFDFAWPAHRVALEVEGGIWTEGRHTRGSGFLKDMEKYNEAARLGWRVMRCTPATLDTLSTVHLIADAIAHPSKETAS